MESDPEKNLIVFEDDIIMASDKARYSSYLSKTIDRKCGIHILGGQHGLKLEKYFSLRSVFAEMPLFKYERKKVYRTCCYAITASMLPKFARFRLGNMAFCVDDWDFVSSRLHSKMYFKNIFSHPRNLEASLIGSERRLAK